MNVSEHPAEPTSDSPEVAQKGWDPKTMPDRRKRPTPFLSRYSFFGGKRRGKDRSRKDDSTFVDLYSIRVWAALSIFLVLNLLDAHFTLLYLIKGGEEANPIAVMLMDGGIPVFVGVKSLGVGIGAALFCILKNFPNARMGVALALLAYQVLLIYHLFLYFYADLA